MIRVNTEHCFYAASVSHYMLHNNILLLGATNGERIEVQSLGSSISADGSSDEDIEQRISAATREIGAMRKKVLEQRELQKETKLWVFNALVVHILLHE